MTIPSQPAGTVSPPNSLPAESAGVVAIPNDPTAKAVGAVAIPNSVTSKAVGTVAIPNNPNAVAVGAVAIPNNPSAVAAGVVAVPNTVTSESATVLPRALTPLINLNFASGNYAEAGVAKTLSDITTFSRNSVGTFINRQVNNLNQYEYFLDTALANVLRIEYDPLTGESLGALIEDASENVLIRSKEFDSDSWVKGAGASIDANAALASDLTMTADVVDISGADSHQITQPFTQVDDVDYVVSISLASSNTASEFQIAYYDGSSPISVGSVMLTNKLTRYEFTFTSSAAVSAPIIRLVGFGNFNDGDKITMTEAQLELGTVATSFMETGSVPVSRLADNLSVNKDIVLPALTGEYSVSAEVSVLKYINVNSFEQSTYGAATASTPSRGESMFYNDGDSVTSVTAGSAQGHSFTPLPDVFHKLTKSFGLSSGNLYIDGGAPLSLTKGADPAITSDLFIGSDASNSLYLLGHVKSFKTYNAELTALEESQA